MKKQKKIVFNLKKTFFQILGIVLCSSLFVDNIKAEYNGNPESGVAIVQQKRAITAIIKDAAGEAVIGASIVEKGTTNGITTEIDGAFSLSVSPNATVVISYIGYITQEIRITNQTSLNILLREDVTALEEVVVVGYGVMKKSDLTGAVSRGALDDKSSLPNMNLSQALSGTMAGVNLQSRGMAGGDADISIRGQTTLSASKNPLIVVDGIIFNGALNDISVATLNISTY